MANVDTNIQPFAPQVLARVQALAGQINYYSAALDVPSVGIAGSVAREMNKAVYDYSG